MKVNGKLIEENGQTYYSGKVMDKVSLALPGVNIAVKDQNDGIVSDFDGNFRIAAKKGDVVQFLYTGFKTVVIEL